MKKLDTSFHEQRRQERMKDPEFRAGYQRAKREISLIDGLIRQLEALRIAAEMSKADLARAVGKEPSTIRRLLSQEANPTVRTFVSLVDALDAEITVQPRNPGKARKPSRLVTA